MENLNAEQVISELRKNDSCYVEDIKAIQNAIALITSQEQRIKELTERIERQKTSCRDRWKRLRDEHRCPVCKVKLPDDYKFSYCLECRLKNSDAKKRGRRVK